MQGFWYGCLAIPPWPIAALGVWKITKVEPGAVQRPRNLQRWLVRSATIFFVFLPIFMIRPGYVGFGARLLGDDWSPISQLALNAGIFAPIATAILAFRCAHLSKRAGIAFLQVQFYLLLLLWTPLMLYTILEVLSYSDRYYSPLIFFYDEGGAAGVGHLGLLAPLAFGRESFDWPVWADVFVGCWFLVMLLALRGVLKSAKALGSGTARANDQPKPTEGCSNLSPP
jgi:hypothetical protein